MVALDRNNSSKGHNFLSDRLIELKVLLWFSKAVFLVLPMESLLVEEEVLSRQTLLKAEKGHKFWSERWIVLKVLH